MFIFYYKIYTTFLDDKFDFLKDKTVACKLFTYGGILEAVLDIIPDLFPERLFKRIQHQPFFDK